MTPDDSASPSRPLPEGAGPPAQKGDPQTSGPSPERTIWQRVWSYLTRAAALLGAFILLLALLIACAGWYTSRSKFCRSCHIMEPYYRSWQESSHGDVACVQCHFPPGFGGKVRGKMLGLVQLAKYVTRSEGPRPAAEIPDASCLRSGCHETRLLSGRVDFHGIAFDHEPHLERLRRGKKLRCTSCHSQIVQGAHMIVTTSTCFLCHFKDGLFNQGVGTCTRCHQIPKEEYDLGGGITFSHDLAYQRGVDCINCHRDLIRGDGRVPRERCRVCHNRPDDLARIDDHVFMHKTHVTDHEIDCMNCHLEIEHSLDQARLLHAASNCQGCHPDHHRSQINMLEGVGGKTVPSQPGGMLVTRLDCFSCHRVEKESPKGTLWTGSAETCTMCHDPSLVSRLEAYHLKLRAALKEMESSIQRIQDELDPAKRSDERSAALRARFDDLKADWNFLRVANDIHNIHYASTLTRAVREGLSSLCRELKIPEPKVTLPERLETPP
jgi:nitrate/TMAO reductase-like tetraheme cytochrome c subunit